MRSWGRVKDRQEFRDRKRSPVFGGEDLHCGGGGLGIDLVSTGY